MFGITRGLLIAVSELVLVLPLPLRVGVSGCALARVTTGVLGAVGACPTGASDLSPSVADVGGVSTLVASIAEEIMWERYSYSDRQCAATARIWACRGVSIPTSVTEEN